MYFYRNGKEQILDLRGDLIISFNDSLVKTRSKSAGPKTIKSPDGYILNVGKAGFIKRIGVTLKIIAFVWGNDKELVEADTNLNKPYLKAVPNEPPKDYAEIKSDQKSYILYGPEGCGKTKNAEAIANRLGLKTIVDNWDGDPTSYRMTNILYITNDVPTWARNNRRLISYSDAMEVSE